MNFSVELRSSLDNVLISPLSIKMRFQCLFKSSNVHLMCLELKIEQVNFKFFLFSFKFSVSSS